jgi:hypothetical protein
VHLVFRGRQRGSYNVSHPTIIRLRPSIIATSAPLIRGRAQDGLFKQLKKVLIERALGAELTGAPGLREGRSGRVRQWQEPQRYEREDDPDLSELRERRRVATSGNLRIPLGPLDQAMRSAIGGLPDHERLLLDVVRTHIIGHVFGDVLGLL